MYKNVIAGVRRSGKTTTLAKLIACAATQPNQTILVQGYVRGQFVRERLIIELERWNNPLNKVTTDSIILENGTQILFRPFGAKGHEMSLDLLAIDDVEGLCEEDYLTIVPCIKPNGSMITTMTVNA